MRLFNRPISFLALLAMRLPFLVVLFYWLLPRPTTQPGRFTFYCFSILATLLYFCSLGVKHDRGLR